MDDGMGYCFLSRSPLPSPLSNSSPLRQTLSASPAAEATEAKRLRRWPWPHQQRCRGGRGRGRRRTQSFQRPPKEMARTRRVSEQRRMEGGKGREERKENNGSRSLAKRRRVSILMILVCDWGKGGIFASTFCPLLTWKGLGHVSRQTGLARQKPCLSHTRG